MAKLALCMKAANAPQSVIDIRTRRSSGFVDGYTDVLSVLRQTDITMEDRATCETDPSLLQFIPYIVVLDYQGRIFNYSRGGASGEARLTGKMSIGLGGHVDSLPPEGADLMQHLRLEGKREIEEEIKVDLEANDLILHGLLVNAETPVDEVHIGILAVYQMHDEPEITAEEGVIEKGVFSHLYELLEPQVFDRMENWSKIALRELASNMKDAYNVLEVAHHPV